MRVNRTQQRQAIYEVLMHAPGPLCTQEIHDAAAREIPQLGIATVYRTINLLLEQGQIQAVTIGSKDIRYEPANREHHHHFLCRVCNTVYDMPCIHSSMSQMLPEGFSMDEHEIIIRGTCSKCIDKQNKDAKPKQDKDPS
ncbi:MAG: Fur family transcriptional regulator [Phycisphaeraceae bacterium JB051]